MFEPFGIGTLSKVQISRLRNGHSVRVKHGNVHKLFLTEEQIKKIMRAHKHGKSINLKLSYPQQYHLKHGEFPDVNMKKPPKGRGIFSNIGNMVTSVARQAQPFISNVTREVTPAVIDIGKELATSYAKKKLGVGIKKINGGALYPAGAGQCMQVAKRRGKGLIGKQLGSILGSVAGDFLPF